MKYGFSIFIFLMTIGCTNVAEQKTDSNELLVAQNSANTFGEQQAEILIDSIGELLIEPLVYKASFTTDSIFRSYLRMDKKISDEDFRKLKNAVKNNKIDYLTAKRIFGKFDTDGFYKEQEYVPVSFFSFDKNQSDFNEFAICLDNPNVGQSCDVYFFESNKLMSRHKIHHRYGLDLHHYKDTDGKTIIYYKENFYSGSGIWWFNYYFYKYYDNEIIPILNEIENVNLQFPWGSRILWIKTVITNTNPLTLKMTYNQAFSDSSGNSKFIDDTTSIKYVWDAKALSLIGEYDKSKLSRAKLYSYYIQEDELLFVRAYSETLKQNLLDKELRQSTLNYLNELVQY